MEAPRSPSPGRAVEEAHIDERLAALGARGATNRYRLLGADAAFYWSDHPGVLGGNGAARIYGRLDCPAALRALERADRYREHRVFFASEEDAIAAGFRPCARCMPDRYRIWKSAQNARSSGEPAHL